MRFSATSKHWVPSRRRSADWRWAIRGLAELARQIEEIAERVLARTTTQKDLTEVVASSGASGTIESTRRPAGDILAEWRELERRADGAKPGSAEAAEVAILLDRVHDEYRAAVDSSRSA